MREVAGQRENECGVTHRCGSPQPPGATHKRRALMEKEGVIVCLEHNSSSPVCDSGEDGQVREIIKLHKVLDIA